MDKKTILTVAGLAAALVAGGAAALMYVHSAQERDRDALQRVLSEQFASFDKDGDKFMSKTELEQFARGTYHGIVRGDETPAQQPRAEFIALYKKNANTGQSAAELERDAQAMFSYADLNGDDVLTQDEYTTFYMKGLAKMGWPDFETKGIPLLSGPRAPTAD